MHRGVEPTTAAAHPFDHDTAVTPTAEHTYAASISDRRNRLGGGPSTSASAVPRRNAVEPLHSCAVKAKPR